MKEFYILTLPLLPFERCLQNPKGCRNVQTPHFKKERTIPREKGECYRQNHPDKTNMGILNFADNKDLDGGELSESLTSVPVIDGTRLEMKIKPPLPTHSSNNVCLCTLNFKPRFPIRLFFCPSYYFAPSSPRHYFFAFHCLYLYSTTSNERTNEQTNERTVTYLFSRPVHLLLTITNFLPFASFLFLLTLDRLRR
jgi:hypothetical protein